MSITSKHCLPNQLYHLKLSSRPQIQLFQSAQDYLYFIDLAGRRAIEAGVSCHSFTILENEAHFLITPSAEQSVKHWVAIIAAAYRGYLGEQAVHCDMQVTGLSLIDDECYALTLSRYIELLPVIRGVTARPDRHNYSSYHEHAERATPWGSKLLTQHQTYQELGLTVQERRRRYKAMFCLPIPRNTLKQISHANTHFRVVGDDLFKRRLERRLARELSRQAQREAYAVADHSQVL